MALVSYRLFNEVFSAVLLVRVILLKNKKLAAMQSSECAVAQNERVQVMRCKSVFPGRALI